LDQGLKCRQGFFDCVAVRCAHGNSAQNDTASTDG
jgi:hypothetical protein